MRGYPVQYAGTFIAIALVCGLLAIDVSWWPARLALGQATFAFLAVAAIYLIDDTRLFMKSPAGRRSLLSRLLLWPFDLLNGLLFNVYQRLLRQPPYVEVVPGLFLGRRLWDHEASQFGACSVVDLTCELDENRVMRALPGYRCLPVLDNTCPTQEQLRTGVDWLGELLKSGRVYVHCAAGHGRSATLVLAYLLTIGKVKDVAEGIAFLKRLRPGVHLNACQKNALCVFLARAGA